MALLSSRRWRRASVTASYDAIVVGLGGIGSAAAYRLAAARRAPDPRAGAVRARPRPRRLAGRLPDHPPLLPPAPSTSSSRSRPRRRGARSRRPRARPVITITGGLDLAPARRPGIDRRLRRRDDRRRRAVRVAGRRRGDATLAAVAPRPRDAGDLPGGRRDRGSGARQPGPPAPRPRRRRGAAGARARRPRSATTAASTRSRWREARLLTTGAVVLATDAWTNDLLGAARDGAAAQRHARAGHLVRGRRSRSCSSPGASRSGSGSASRRSTASRPTADRARRSARTSAVALTTARTRGFDPDLDCLDRCGAFFAERMPGAIGKAVHDQDLPLHGDAGSGLRPRSRAGASRRRRGARLGPRLQVRGAVRELARGPRARSRARRRPDAGLDLFAIDRPAMLRVGPPRILVGERLKIITNRVARHARSVRT